MIVKKAMKEVNKRKRCSSNYWSWWCLRRANWLACWWAWVGVLWGVDEADEDEDEDLKLECEEREMQRRNRILILMGYEEVDKEGRKAREKW